MGPIEKAKDNVSLPEKGTPVKIRILHRDDVVLVDVKDEHLENRKNGPGKYIDFVAGSSGDCWWIENEDGTVGVYSYVEVFDVEEE